MQYSELITLLEGATESFRGSLDFGVGTNEELNTGTHEYPLLWVNGVTVGTTLTQSIVSQSIRVRIKVLQSGSVGNTTEQDQDLFDETFRIINGFTDKIFRVFQGNDATDSIAFGDITPIYRQQDAIHIGWETTLVLGSFVDNDCCSLFE